MCDYCVLLSLHCESMSYLWLLPLEKNYCCHYYYYQSLKNVGIARTNIKCSPLLFGCKNTNWNLLNTRTTYRYNLEWYLFLKYSFFIVKLLLKPIFFFIDTCHFVIITIIFFKTHLIKHLTISIFYSTSVCHYIWSCNNYHSTNDFSNSKVPWHVKQRAWVHEASWSTKSIVRTSNGLRSFHLGDD